MLKKKTFSRLRVMAPWNWLGRLRRTECGSALIEMAALSPLLLVLVFGAGDFGRIMYYAITLTNSARAGAAYGTHSTGRLSDRPGIQLAAEEEAQNLPPITVVSQTICECGGAAVSCATTISCPGYGPPLAFTEVTVSTTFTPLTASFPGIPNASVITRVAKVRAQ